MMIQVADPTQAVVPGPASLSTTVRSVTNTIRTYMMPNATGVKPWLEVESPTTFATS